MAACTLPGLPCGYGALESAMSGEILELHHSKHHAACVKSADDTLGQLAEAAQAAAGIIAARHRGDLAAHASGSRA